MLCLVDTQKCWIKTLFKCPICSNQKSVVIWWTICLTEVLWKEVSLIIDFSCCCGVNCCFVCFRFSFLLNWISEWPTWIQKIMFLTAFLGNDLRSPFSPYPPILFVHEQAVKLMLVCMESPLDFGGWGGLWISNLQLRLTYLNFSWKNTLRKLPGVLEIPPASFIVLAPNLCPMGRGSAVWEWFGSLPPALPLSVVCLSCSWSAGNLQQQ